jgi:hypothetical protein
MSGSRPRSSVDFDVFTANDAFAVEVVEFLSRVTKTTR